MNRMFSTNRVGTKGLAFGGEEIGVGLLVCACLFKMSIFGGGSILRGLMMPVLGSHIELDELEDKHTIIHVLAPLEPSIVGKGNICKCGISN